MELAAVILNIIHRLGVRKGAFAKGCGLHTSQMTHVQKGTPVTVATVKCLMAHPDLTAEEKVQISIAWVADRRTDLGMTETDFSIVPTAHQSLVRLTGDPALIQAMRGLAIRAKNDPNCYKMLMSLSEAVK